MANTRERLLGAAKDLLWERGYDAMSPRDVLTASGTGQGSLYHFFAGKAELAATAICEVEAEMSLLAENILRADLPPLACLRAYLLQPRDYLLGCRLGRLAADAGVIKHEELRAPITAYYAHLEEELARVITAAQAEGSLRGDLAAAALADMIISLIQGGYVLARATQNATKMQNALNATVAVLESMRP